MQHMSRIRYRCLPALAHRRKLASRSATVAPKKARFSASSNELCEVIKPVVTSAKWVHYAENSGGKRDPAALLAHKRFIRALWGLNPALGFNKISMKSAFEQIAEESKFPELDTPEKLEDWVRTMDLGVRTMCRHVCQSKSQSPTPKWMAHLELPADSPHFEEICEDSSRDEEAEW